ncbi:Rad51 protein (macronuclear) [Tetrahymena thermophila SB210]|uniref:Rad51 protein n=1 Tax=Tetrahymena thermophila (strain SB210) TaxID=312017 RepID=Q24DN8_TETTS|nr:Rad51 protein [Tetrahymena thermophila SB210]EAS05875.4 Rad51 protein [Tetrahymena thermophila SB210]|eukprot:XP_001026120.4 Rad51 protein [Tetrahymena thermophila SB210]
MQTQNEKQLQLQNYLEQLGVSNIYQYCLSYEEDLLKLNRMTNKQLNDAQYKISSSFCKTPLQNAKELLKKQQNLQNLTFGEKELDDLLEGGLQIGKVYELSGYPCSGKSILAQKLISQNFKCNQKGAWYLDISNQFNLKRFLKMYGLNAQKKEFEKCFYHQIIQDAKSLYISLCILMSQLSQNKYYNQSKINLLVIDNFAMILRKKEPYSEYLSYITQIINIIKQMCSEYNLTVLTITNQEEKIIFKSKTEDIFRNKSNLSIWNFVPDSLILIENQLLITSENFQRNAKISYTVLSDIQMKDQNTVTVNKQY